MIPDWLNFMWAPLAAGLTRGTALFLFAAALTGLWKGLASEARHIVWLGVVCSFLLVPLAWLSLTSFALGPHIPVQPGAAYRLAVAPVLSRDAYAGLVATTVPYASLTRQHAPVLLRWLTSGLPIVWLAGVLALAGRLAWGLRSVTRAARTGRADARLQNAVDSLSAALALSRRASVLLSSWCTSPFTFGILRPVILLPEAARNWRESRARCVLSHELAHIRRRDVLSQSVGYAICMLFWFFPPVWIAFAAMVREAEKSCDGAAVEGGIRRAEYARVLLNIARSRREHVLLPGTINTFGRKTMVHERITNVLGLRPGARRFGRWAAMRVLVICLCCIVPLLALTCATKPMVVKPDDPIFGTWVNEEYDKGNRAWNARFEMFPDGRELDYLKSADQTPSNEGRNVFEEKWVDTDGNHWYKIRATNWLYPSKAGYWEGFAVVRVSASGTVLEGVSAELGYPKDVSPLGPGYGIYYKR
jgi:beta-lactamase regulating signal transducer with metallopeptidase domain